jgi:PAS domain S-box-containing protein
LLAERLPIFAGLWLPTTLAWSLALHFEGLLGPFASLATPALHALIVVTTIALCRADPAGPRVFPLVMGACIAFGLTAIALFAAVRGGGDFLAYVLLTLYLLCALCFTWGWRAEVTLWAVTVVPWALAIPALRFRFPTVELATAIVTGSVICVAVAEGAARSFATAFHHGVNEARSRRALEASRNAYRDLAEQAHEPILTVDPEGRFTYVNAALARCLGEPAEKLVNRSMFEFLSPHPINQGVRELLAAPGDVAEPLPMLEFEACTANGPRWFETVPSIIRNPDGGVGGVRAICRDVTERKSLERERDAVVVREHGARIEAERARTEAEAAARARDDFVAVLSHELRSPLQVVLLGTRMLRSGLVDPEKVPEALASIEDAASAQSRLVADLLDISRIAAGKFSLQVVRLDLAALLAARMEALRQPAAEKGIVLEADLDASVGAVNGDAIRLLQVFDNLLLNAVKFTPRGGRVTVTLERAGSDAQVTVRDMGIGIPAEVLPYVFDQFQQADGSITRRYGGLGLGLAIARRLVELHGGRIEAESPGEGQGATFRVRLPLAEAPGPEPTLRRGNPSTRPLSSLDRIRVLVVDDERSARDLLTMLLARCGAEVRSASSVREALEGIETTAPDVLVADIAMPGEDGYTLIRKLRATERGQRIAAIAVTALTGPEDRERAMAEGFHEHLAKPVDPAELVDAIARSARGAW